MMRRTAAKPWTERLTVTIPEYGEIIGCSRTTAYESVRAGDVDTIKVHACPVSSGDRALI